MFPIILVSRIFIIRQLHYVVSVVQFTDVDYSIGLHFVLRIADRTYFHLS